MKRDPLYPLRRLHGWLIEKKMGNAIRKSYQDQFREKQRKNPRTVYLILTPEHGNLGDHAIAKATQDLLESLNIDYVEITSQQLHRLNRFHILGLMNGAPIMINGGGNMGTLWMDCEELHRSIVAKNPRSPIFIMPNTVFFEDSAWGKEEYRKTAAIFNRHKRLFLYARERYSYEIMKEAYRNATLIPDMVLSLNESHSDLPRKGCILCLRGDTERTRTEQQDQTIRQQAAALFGDAVRTADMDVGKGVPPAQREQALREHYAVFRGAELVITDRLHGMIFCAITGTPCIVIASKSHKLLGCYEWIKELGYIRFADSCDQIAAEYHKLPQGPHRYDNGHLSNYYQQLRSDILEKLQ